MTFFALEVKKIFNFANPRNKSRGRIIHNYNQYNHKHRRLSEHCYSI